MSARTPGLLPLSPRVPALEAELARLDAELGHSLHPAWRKLLAIERRRVVIRIDQLGTGAAA